MPEPIEPRLTCNARESVRTKPGMYFGGIGVFGVEQMLSELVSNGIDEFLAGRASELQVRLSDEVIEVSDDGAGVAFGAEIKEGVASLIRLHFTRSADDHAPHIHLHGAVAGGLAAVNAASSYFKFQTWQNGQRWEQEFRRGVPERAACIVRDEAGRGTRITLTPDASIFGPVSLSRGSVRARLLEAVHLFPGLTVRFQEEAFYAPGGLAELAWLHYRVFAHGLPYRSPPSVFHFQGKVDEVTLAVVALGTADDGQPVWNSWVNGSRTIGGTHCEGFHDALCDVRWKPSVVLLHVVVHDPRYAGPVKDCLEVPAIRPQIAQGILPALRQFCREQRLGRYRRPI